MTHPNEGRVTKLGLKKCVHKNFSPRNTHVRDILERAFNFLAAVFANIFYVLLNFNLQSKVIPSNFSESSGLAYSAKDGIYRCLTSFNYQRTKLKVSYLFLL